MTIDLIILLQASASNHYSSNDLNVNKAFVQRMELQASVYYPMSSTKDGWASHLLWQTRRFQEPPLSMSIDLNQISDLKLCPPANNYSTELSFSSYSTSDREDSPEVSSMNFRTGVGK
jgi:hypothetical protein